MILRECDFKIERFPLIVLAFYIRGITNVLDDIGVPCFLVIETKETLSRGSLYCSLLIRLSLILLQASPPTLKAFMLGQEVRDIASDEVTEQPCFALTNGDTRIEIEAVTHTSSGWG